MKFEVTLEAETQVRATVIVEAQSDTEAVKLWLISQDANDGYGTYSDAVVAAKTEADARLIHPLSCYEWVDHKWRATWADGSTYDEGGYGTWAPSPDLVKVERIGMAKQDTKPGVICASFHAG